MGEIASLAAGSLFGGLARHYFGGFAQRLAGGGFPFGTLLVNVLGCFAIGLLHGLAVNRLCLGPNARLALMAGFCGAFTTFSALMLDTALMMDKGRGLHALLNLAASVLLGLALFKLGLFVSELRWSAGKAGATALVAEEMLETEGAGESAG